jgi:hypothetical protein
MMASEKRKKEGHMYPIALVLLFAVSCSALLVIPDEKARLAVMGGTCVFVFLVTFERGSRIWPASFLGGAFGVLALAQVRHVGRAGWVVAIGACVVLCVIATVPLMVTSMRELKASCSRLVAAIADKERLDRTRI